MTGSLIWRFETGGPIFSSPLVLNSVTRNETLMVIGSHDNHVYCLSIDGVLLWRFNAQSPVYSTPSFIELPLQCSSQHPHSFSSRFIVACSTKGKVFIIDIMNGSRMNFYDLPNEVFSSPVVCGGEIIVGCRDDFVYCLRIL